ncbi:hypothetical protein [Chryseobacterium wanjuense]
MFNFLKNQITNSTQFKVHTKARRLLLDIDDIAKFLKSNCINIKNETINFAYPYYYDLKEIIGAIQNEMEKQANYEESDEGDFYKVDFDDTTTHFFTGITADEYLKLLAKKYL